VNSKNKWRKEYVIFDSSIVILIFSLFFVGVAAYHTYTLSKDLNYWKCKSDEYHNHCHLADRQISDLSEELEEQQILLAQERAEYEKLKIQNGELITKLELSLEEKTVEKNRNAEIKRLLEEIINECC